MTSTFASREPRYIAQRVLSNTAANIASKAVALGLAFALTPVILHRLGAVEFGIWILAGSLFAHGSLLDLGMGSAITKFVAQHHATGEVHKTGAIVAAALGLYALFGVGVFMVAVGLAPVFPQLFTIPQAEAPVAFWTVLFVGASAAVSIPCAATTAILRGLNRYDIVSGFGVIGAFVSAILTVSILVMGGGVIGLTAMGVPLLLLMQVPAIVTIRKLVPDLRLDWRQVRRTHVRQLLSFSTPVLLVDSSYVIQSRSLAVILGAYHPVAIVAGFSFARKLSTVPQILAEQFSKTLLPVAAEVAAVEGGTRLRTLFLSSLRISLAVLVPITLVLAFYAGPVLALWVGPSYAIYASVCVLLLIAALIETCQWSLIYVLQGIDAHRPVSMSMAWEAAATILLSIVLVPAFGAAGVAGGVGAAKVFNYIGYMLPQLMRTLGVPLREITNDAILPAVLPAVPSAILLYIARSTEFGTSNGGLFVAIGSVAVLYWLVYLRFGAGKAEKTALAGLWGTLITRLLSRTPPATLRSTSQTGVDA